MSTIARPVVGELEQRTAPDIEVAGARLRGTIPYNVESRDLGGWREVMDRGCLAGARLDNLTCRPVDHDGLPLGRHPSTLELEDRDDGMHWSVELPASRSDIREAVERGDLRSSSWRMIVAAGGERWENDVRHITRVEELRDVSLAVNPAYPDARAEYRTLPEESPMSETATAEVEERTAPEPTPDPEPPPAARGTLRAENRSLPSRPTGLADRFRAAGFPGEAATLPFDDVLEDRALTWTGNVDRINPIVRAGGPLGADERYAWPAFPRVGVDAGVTSVDVLSQTSRTLADADDVIRNIDAVTTKPETSSVLAVTPTPLKQVASVESGIPNIFLEQAAFNTVVENDLRLAINGGLDKLILDAVAAAGFRDPGTDPLLVAIRKTITVIEASGYSPNVLILRPSDAELLDTLRANATDELYVFEPGAAAPGTIFGLQRRISKDAASPVVVDSNAFGRLYTSPVSLQRFEADAGVTNKSNVRLELNAVFGTERLAAAVRIAAS